MAEGERPLPIEDLDSCPFWEAARQHRLMLPRCTACGWVAFPPRSCCSRCLSADLAWIELSGRGRIFSYCIVHEPVVTGLKTPYVVAQIELQEQRGLRLNANVIGCDHGELRIDMPVEVIFEDLDAVHSLPQFRPVARGSTGSTIEAAV